METDHCWQYEIRQRNFNNDLIQAALNPDAAAKLKVSDFKFEYIDKYSPQCDEIKNFINKHEWLGKMPQRPTHRFVATYNDLVAGVIVMASPNAFSNTLGKNNRNIEKLISRGACISWAPPHLNSWLIMMSIRWMVNNTEFRVFSGYSDTEAGELGTIYQACNFIYLGKKSGARIQCFDQGHPEKGWFSDREFRKCGAYKRYAKKLNINWEDSWSTGGVIHWDKMCPLISTLLKQASKDHKSACEIKKLPRKHKYIYIKGRSKKETKRLRKKFLESNPKLIQANGKLGLEYPKKRGQ